MPLRPYPFLNMNTSSPQQQFRDIVKFQNEELATQTQFLQQTCKELEKRENILKVVSFACEKLLLISDWNKCLPDILARLGHVLGITSVTALENAPCGFSCYWNDISSIQPDFSPLLTEVIPQEKEPCQGGPVPPAEIYGPLDTLPSPIKKIVANFQIKSIAIIPVFLAEKSTWGILIFADSLTEREWSPLEIQTLKTATSVIGATISRERILSDRDQKRIRQLKQAHIALNESSAHFELITMLAKDAIVMLDGSGKVIFWNPAAEEIFGYCTCEIMGKNLSCLFPGKDQFNSFQKRFTFFINTILSGQGKIIGNTRKFSVIHKNGSPLTVEIALSGKYNKEGFFVVGLCRDVTLRQRAEQARKESEKKYRILSSRFENFLNAIPDALYEVNAKGAIIWANSGCEKLFGLETKHLIGKNCQDFLLADPDDKSIALQTLATGKSKTKEVSYVDGHTWKLRSFPIKKTDDSINTVVICGQDLTDQRAYEASAARNSHLAALGTLTAGVAHEINNPNNFIMLNSPIIEEICKDSLSLLETEEGKAINLAGFTIEEAKDLLPLLMEGVREGSERIKSIVQDLKEFSSQNNREQFTTCSLNDIVKKTMVLCQSLMNKFTHNFTVVYDEDCQPVFCNPGQIEQVIINLLINAGESLPSTDKKITLQTFTDLKKKQSMVMIKDEGCGITPTNLDKIFTPFYTTKLESGGTGLGLSVSYSIIKSHNGRIFFQSDPCQGTTAYIALPILKNCLSSGSDKKKKKDLSIITQGEQQ
ncbi:MAG: PAS domain S-box protein [Desulfobulbaceae bacterium]|nr:PAS domain S-box protein [Desulfobulbaceae bacterium]